MEQGDTRFKCPCCGYLSFDQPPGSFEICHICYWEDDPVQLLDPTYEGGASRPSLLDCQANFDRVQACEERFKGNVRPPGAEDTRDDGWRSAGQADAEGARRRYCQILWMAL